SPEPFQVRWHIIHALKTLLMLFVNQHLAQASPLNAELLAPHGRFAVPSVLAPRHVKPDFFRGALLDLLGLVVQLTMQRVAMPAKLQRFQLAASKVRPIFAGLPNGSLAYRMGDKHFLPDRRHLEPDYIHTQIHLTYL